MAERTRYFLMTTPQDAQLCEWLRQDLGEQRQDFGFPTIVAKREDRVIGYLSSYLDAYGMIIGPLLIAKDIRPQFVFLRLLEAMEEMLRRLDIPGYRVWVHANQQHYITQVQRFSQFKLLTKDNHRYWYERAFEEYAHAVPEATRPDSARNGAPTGADYPSAISAPADGEPGPPARAPRTRRLSTSGPGSPV